MKLGRFVLGLLALWPAVTSARDLAPAEAAAVERVVEAENFDHQLLARQIFRLTNGERRSRHIAELKADPHLTKAADDQAAQLSIRIHSGHDSPLARQNDPYARVEFAGLPDGTVAENAATLGIRNKDAGRNYTYLELANVVVQAWMDSAGHRANLLNPELHYLGCGTRVARLLKDQTVVYAIQDFYTPAPTPPEPPPPAIRPGGTSITR